MPLSQPTDAPLGHPRRALSLVDSTSIMVGIIIGSTIYESSPDIAAGAARWSAGMSEGGQLATSSADLALVAIVGVWIIGGLIALVGALCYAELATAYPRAGGTYVFLSEAFGRSFGFAFAWAEFWIVRPGNVGAIAFVLASYGRQMIAPAAENPHLIELVLGALAIVSLAVLNGIGLRAGKWTQNLLTAAKLGGLAAIVVTACTLPAPAEAAAIAGQKWQTLGLSLILVMFAYGGWADVSFVAAEVRDPERNIFRALVLGTIAVTAIYLAVNLAFLRVLGVGGVVDAHAVAAKVMAFRFGAAGSMAISLLVVVSCLGTINGMMFAGARVFYALGEHHPTFRWLGVWNSERQVPMRALVVQTLVTLALVVGFGFMKEGFKGLVVFTGPFYWGFIGLVGLALIFLRRQGRGSVTYQTPFFPLLPLLLFVSGTAMAGSAVHYVLQQRTALALWGVGACWAAAVVVSGVIAGIVDYQTRHRR